MPRKSLSLRISLISYGSDMMAAWGGGAEAGRGRYYHVGFFSRENNDNNIL